MQHVFRDSAKVRNELRALMEEILEQDPCGPLIIRQALDEAEKSVDWTLPLPMLKPERNKAAS